MRTDACIERTPNAYPPHTHRTFKEPAVAVDVNPSEYSAHDSDRRREAIESHLNTASMTPLGL